MLSFIVITLLTFINAYATRIVSLIVKSVVHDTSAEELSLHILQLKKELNLISMVDEFANYARLERKINKLEEEKKSLNEKNASRMSKLKYKLLFAIYIITSVIMLTIIWLWRSEAVATLPAEWLWPVPHIFSWFYDTPGCISAPSWIVMSSTASKIIANNF